MLSTTFPAPPLKFRTSGFPQYGFKPEFDHDLRQCHQGLSAGPTYTSDSMTYTWPRVRSAIPCGPQACWSGSRYHGPSGPEALGSPVGSAVPPGHRLLWPHPTLSAPPTGLFPSSRRVFALRPCMGWNREPPQFAPRVFPTMPSPVPRRTERLHSAVASPSVLAFALFAWARHPHPHARRFLRG